MIKVIKPGIQLITPKEMFSMQLKIIETMGRTCYQSEAKSTEPTEFIERIALKYGHLSVIEHGVASFRFVIDRSCSHQLVRHRIGSYSQSSQRYINYNKQGELMVIAPQIDKDDYNSWHSWVNTTEDCFSAYKDLVLHGVKPEESRSLLPNCTATEVGTTFNFSMWRHVFKKRALNKRAQWQIRCVMQMALETLNGLVPCMFEDQYDYLACNPDIDVRHLGAHYEVVVRDRYRELVEVE